MPSAVYVYLLNYAQLNVHSSFCSPVNPTVAFIKPMLPEPVTAMGSLYLILTSLLLESIVAVTVEPV